MRGALLLVVLGAVGVCAPAAGAFTVTASPAALPTPLQSKRGAAEERARFAANDRARVTLRDVKAFVPLYGRASRRFDVAWLLLASIHKQETAFSRAGGTYHGLNYVGCCAGPMQFNVTNGPVSTWRQFRHAHLLAPRPGDYPHPTRRHPSVYDDYDAIMAAAQLLRANGATTVLADGSAWRAAYLYYGPGDLGPGDFGITYADEVVARALNWERRGFCPACRAPAGLIAAVHDAWAPAQPQKHKHHKHHKHKHRRHKVRGRELRARHDRRGAAGKDGARRARPQRRQKAAHVRPHQRPQQPTGGPTGPTGPQQGGRGPDADRQPPGVGGVDGGVLPDGGGGAAVHGAAAGQGPGAAPAGGPPGAGAGGQPQPGAAAAG